MTVEINGVKINGTESQNPTHAKRGVSATIYDANGEEVAYEAEGRTQYTGGVNWDTPIVDVGAYLKEGENTIRIVYNSSITNAALAAGIIAECGQMEGQTWYGAPSFYWGQEISYRSNGPVQAKLVPYKDILLAM